MNQNHREVDKIGKGASGAVRVDDAHGGSTLTYGRQFSADSGSLYSSITRETINALKAHFRDQVSVENLALDFLPLACPLILVSSPSGVARLWPCRRFAGRELNEQSVFCEERRRECLC